MTRPSSADEPQEPFDVPEPEPAPEPKRDSAEPTARPRTERVIGGASIPPSERSMRNATPRIIE